MAEPVSPVNDAESPSTRPEMASNDDAQEHQQETGRVSPLGHDHPSSQSDTPKPRVSFAEEAMPPAKPPRPISPMAQAEQTLIEAFPSIDVKVVKAVLVASGGRVDPAFNALLSMSDPDFRPDDALPPPQPPRPATREPRNQLEADERYARQLADHYDQSSRHQPEYAQRARRGPNQQPRRPSYSDDITPDADISKEHSFFDDDLPVIRQNIQKGFFETQKKVNSWITTFKKQIDGDEAPDDDLYSGPPGEYSGRQNFGPGRAAQMDGIRRSADAARERERYDQDPHVLGDDEFSRLELHDEETPPKPPRPARQAAPDLFKSVPRAPQSGPVDEVDAMDRKIAAGGGGGAKDKKWQPLTSAAPNPADDNDPFSLGDSDEERDKGADVAEEATARLKSKARESVNAGGGAGKGLEESEGVGTKDKDAEELLAGGTKS